jgi:hypothetical protein
MKQIRSRKKNYKLFKICKYLKKMIKNNKEKILYNKITKKKTNLVTKFRETNNELKN